MAGNPAQQLCRCRTADHPRPALSRQRRHPHHRTRPRHPAQLPRSFSAYETRKAEELVIEEEQNRKFDKFHAQEEVWIRKGIEARRTRNEGRVRRLEQLRRERAARRERVGKVNLQIDAGGKSGKLIAELKDVSKGYAGRTLISGFSSRLMRGDKIGLIGPNGAGKTTLLKLILGEIPPDSGEVRQGTGQQIAYFDQFRSQLPEDAAIIDVIGDGKDYVDISGQRKHVMSYLEDFLFSPARARSPVRSLSGGERNRLLLAKLFTQPANILVLDEPTNDLDIDTLELLEQLLIDYPAPSSWSATTAPSSTTSPPRSLPSKAKADCANIPVAIPTG